MTQYFAILPILVHRIVGPEILPLLRKVHLSFYCLDTAVTGSHTLMVQVAFVCVV